MQRARRRSAMERALERQSVMLDQWLEINESGMIATTKGNARLVVTALTEAFIEAGFMSVALLLSLQVSPFIREDEANAGPKETPEEIAAADYNRAAAERD